MTFIITLVLFTVSVIPQSQIKSNPVVSQAIKMGISQPMRDLPLIDSKTSPIWTDGIIPLREPFDMDVQDVSKDGSLQEYKGPLGASSITKNFDGVGAGGYAPPDPSGDVGPNHYVQMVNVRTQIWDKNGISLAGPFDNSNFWVGLPGPWSSSNDGDPIVLYDEIADRWMVSQFALPAGPDGPCYILVAISTTPDPTGTYYQYAFTFPKMPDYPKFGIWPDGYYMSANVFSSSAYLGTYAAVFDRNAMLAGGAATMQYFSNPTSTASFLPSDCDGIFPPVGSPNYFLATYNGNGSNTNLDIYEFHVDWATPANSTFTGPLLLATPSFSEPNEIPQLGTTTLLNNLADRPMNRLQYRNFGDHEAMVVCQTVNAGSGRAGIRWWELQKTSGNWSIYQEGTYAPADGLYRWMGSIAMDANGNIALGYSVSSSTIHPDIRYTGRFASDPLGVMTIAETLIHAGGGSQTGGLARWGDYTQMTVDPTEPGTFWYTNEYIPTNGSFNWKTRIAAFNFDPPCPVGYASDPSPSLDENDVSINIPQLSWTNGSGASSTSLYFGTSPGSLSLVQSGSLFSSWDITSLPLSYVTDYYWRVDNANDTCSNIGELWSFRTEPDPNIVLSWSDNFDTYTAGLRLACQNPIDWTTWTLVPCSTVEDALISNAQSYSAPNSVVITQNNDLVHPLGDLTYGKYSISFQMYIPTGKAGFFNTLSGFAPPTYEWGMQCYFNVGGQGSLDAGGVGVATFAFPYDTWVLVELIVDIDNDVAEFKFNGTSIYSWPWSAGATGSGSQLKLAGNDFFGATAQDQMYIDDYTFVDLNVIPVELTSFSADFINNSINLSWITATELNNSGFEIERKSTDNKFVQIGFVPGSGTSTEARTYSFSDTKVTSGNYTYRLKQVDFDGSFEYSNEINIDIKAPFTYNLEQNYPNPFNPSTLIKYSVAQDGFVNVSVFNLLGEKIATLVNTNMQAGRYEVNFNASSLSSGVYFYSIEAGNFKAVRKLMLMK
jgi:hypothetical protein